MPAQGPQNTRAKQKRRKRRVQPPNITATPGDRPSSRIGDAQRNTAAKNTPLYKQASQEAYSAAPTARKRLILKNATGVEGAQARKVHKKRLAQNFIHAQEQHDSPMTAAERAANKPFVDKAVLDSRIKYLRRTRKPADTLKAELEGHGLIAKAGSELAKVIDAGAKTQFGHSDQVLLKGKPKSKQAGLVPDALNPAVMLPRFLKDAVNLPGTALPSVYEPVAGAYEAIAHHDTKRLKKLAQGIDKNDAYYNAGAAVVAAAQGDTKGAEKRAKAALHAATEHPGFTAAEGYGLKGTLGRGVGRTLRSGAAGPKLKAAASTTRDPVVLEGTNLAQNRTYSKDFFAKRKQIKDEQQKAAQAKDLRARADKIEPDQPTLADEYRARANRVDPARVKGKEIRRRVDERVAVNEDIRRIGRGEVSRHIDTILKPLRDSEKPIVALIAQRFVDPTREDLSAYLTEIQAHHDKLDAAGKRANQATQRQIRAVLNDNKADLGRVDHAAEQYHALTKPLQDKLAAQEVIGSEQGRRARYIPYAIRKMGAKNDPAHWVDGEGKRVSESEVRALRENEGDQTVRALLTHVPARVADRHGNALTTDAIAAHMGANGVKEPAFITHAPNQRGAKNFNIRSERAQGILKRRRTGEAARTGTFDLHPDVLHEGASRAQGLADAVDGFTGFVKEVGIRGDNGEIRSFTDRKRAEKARDNLNADTHGGHEWQLVRIQPWGGRTQQLEHLLHQAGPDELTPRGRDNESPLAASMREALDGSGDGPYALIPKEAAQHLQSHLNRMAVGPAFKGWQMYNSAFRKAVLATNPGWLLGNVTEATMRAALAKAGPASYITGRKVMARTGELNAAEGKALAARAVGGGHYSFVDRQHIRRSAEDFAGTSLEGTAQALGKFWRAPGPKLLADVWHRWTDLTFRVVNSTIERQFQTAMLGKAVRDSHLMDGHLRKTSEAAVNDAAKGLLNTNNQVEFGRAVDVMYGRYSKFSPTERLVIAQASPFLSWYLNAVTFVAKTLPKDHPTTLAVIAGANIATEELRKDKGLDLFLKNGLPMFLQGSIDRRRLSKLTPFGAFTDPGGTLADQVLPQARGVLEALHGKDWKGDPLKGPGSEAKPDAVALAVGRSVLDSTVPILGQGERVHQGGIGALNPVRQIKQSTRKPRIRKTSGFQWQDSGAGDFQWGDGGGGDFQWGG